MYKNKKLQNKRATTWVATLVAKVVSVLGGYNSSRVKSSLKLKRRKTYEKIYKPFVFINNLSNFTTFQNQFKLKIEFTNRI